MKNIYIHVPFLSSEDYALVLERMCPDSVRNITVYTELPKGVKHKDILSLVDVQKSFSKGRNVRFQNHCVFTCMPRFSKKLRSTLRKNGFTVDLQVGTAKLKSLARTVKRLERSGISCKLWIDQSQDQQGTYKLFSSYGLNIHFKDPIYTADTPDMFDKWLFDVSARGVNTFCDIINMLVMDTHSPNCRHASCFGNTFCVDGQLDVYMCPIHRDRRTCLGSLKVSDGLTGLLNCGTVAQLLPIAVQKRQRCMEQCRSFPYCQGGCPLQTDIGTDCDYYSATVERIRQRLLEVYRDQKVCQVNYIVKNAILNALAFGTAFFR